MIFIRLILFSVLVICSKVYSYTTDVLFYLQDAGETYALMPVVKELKQNNVDYKVIVGGVAKNLVKDEKVISLEGVDKNWKREDLLSSSHLQEIIDSVESKVFITGVAFELQGQLLKAFGKKRVKTFAYWDNFSVDGANSYFTTAHKVEKFAEQLLLPSKELSTFFQDRPFSVVGQPSLDLWRKIHTDDFHLLFDKKIIVYVGGYGEDYEQGFRLFLKGLTKSLNEDFQVIVLPHPKTDGSFERKECTGLDVQIMAGVPTQKIAALADIIICHQSTVGVQALAIPKPVLYVIPPSQQYSNFLIEKGYVKRIGENKDLEVEIRKALSSTSVDLYQVMGIPEDAVKNLRQIIEKALVN